MELNNLDTVQYTAGTVRVARRAPQRPAAACSMMHGGAQ